MLKRKVSCQKIFYINIIIILLMLLGIMTGVTYAWLSAYYESETGIAADTSTTEAIPVHMWIYNTEADGSKGWHKYTATNTGTDNEEAMLPSILAKTGNANTYKYDINSLHFGSIINLVSLSDDNIVYFRFDLSKEENGTMIALDITKPANSISGYDRTGTLLSNDIRTKLNSLDDTNPHMNFEYAISDTEYEPGTTEFRSLSWKDADFKVENKLNTYKLEKDIGEADSHASENYYLYLRVTPNLHTLGYTATILSSSMPCQLTFDWDIELTVHPVTD